MPSDPPLRTADIVSLPLPLRDGAPLRRAGGGGTSGGMEARIAHLEEELKELKSDIRGLRKDVSGVRTDVGELKGRVAMLPGYGGMTLIVGLIVGLSTASQLGAKFFP